MSFGETLATELLGSVYLMDLNFGRLIDLIRSTLIAMKGAGSPTQPHGSGVDLAPNAEASEPTEGDQAGVDWTPEEGAAGMDTIPFLVWWLAPTVAAHLFLYKVSKDSSAKNIFE